ncbi:MAG: DUF5050 domain-containing protein [Ignavibacteria bacterium]|nr:DUF5050 domain-containing protein [Ignavibacteria bacterium]
MITYAHSNIDPDFTGIYIINSNGTGKQQIISDFARCPDFSPGGDRIAFTQFENIYKIKTNGDSIVQLTSAGKNYFPKWSADNALIAFSNSINSDEYDIWTMNTDGSQKTLIDSNANYPDWVNGSSSLIYFKPMKNSGGSQTGDTLVQYFLSSNTKQVMAILTGDEHKINMYPSFAGDKIIFCSFDIESTAYVYSMDSDGSNITKLTTTQSYSPDYSPVNEKIVYTNRDKGNGRLWIMDKNGSEKTQLTE